MYRLRTAVLGPYDIVVHCIDMTVQTVQQETAPPPGLAKTPPPKKEQLTPCPALHKAGRQALTISNLRSLRWLCQRNRETLFFHFKTFPPDILKEELCGQFIRY